MDEIFGCTAVVTGAASGIGRALSLRFGAEGLNLVLADIDDAGLKAVARELQPLNVPVLARATDVSRVEELEALAEAAYERFGGAQILCNNAGVGVPGRIWEVSIDDWKWQLGVNLWGAIHGVRAFLPGMIESGRPGHVVNTSSLAGVLWGPDSASWGLGAYAASKHAIVGLSMALDGELKQDGLRIGVSVLCPDAVATKIWDSRQNRPQPVITSLEEDHLVNELRRGVESGRTPEEVASSVIDAIYQDRLFVFSSEEVPARVVDHWAEMLERSG